MKASLLYVYMFVFKIVCVCDVAYLDICCGVCWRKALRAVVKPPTKAERDRLSRE